MRKKLTIRKLFLIDALGALLTASLLSLLIAQNESLFGMPTPTLYPLSGVALIFFVYSLTCYLKKAPAFYLKLIAMANTIYCMATLSLLWYHSGIITSLGYAYFSEEVLIVMSLVWLEWKIASTSTENQK